MSIRDEKYLYGSDGIRRFFPAGVEIPEGFTDRPPAEAVFDLEQPATVPDPGVSTKKAAPAK